MMKEYMVISHQALKRSLAQLGLATLTMGGLSDV